MFDAHTHEELTDSDIEDAYIDFLDCEGEVQVAGLSLYPSTIIKECDPIAYRVGKSDFESFMLDDGEWLEELPEEEEEEEEEEV